MSFQEHIYKRPTSRGFFGKKLFDAAAKNIDANVEFIQAIESIEFSLKNNLRTERGSVLGVCWD